MTTVAAERPGLRHPPLTLEALEEALRAVDPAVILTPPWLLQKIISHDRGRGGSPFTVAHRQIHLIDRRRLLEIANDENLTLPGYPPNVPTLILLVRPEADWIATHPAAPTLREYWRLLFHARIDAELHRKLASCGRGAIEARIERIGRSAFNEARFVLQSEDHLAPNSDARESFAEFAAVFLEFHYFRPDLLTAYFPAIRDPAAVLSALEAEIDAEDLLRETRPAGAADATSAAVELDAIPLSGSSEIPLRADLRRDMRRVVARDARRFPKLQRRADKAAKAGNIVRAAILRMRVFRATPHDKSAHAAALHDLGILIARLRAALHLGEPATQEWRSALTGILSHAAGGWWNPESRLLYDLQKVCVDHEQEIYSVGVVEWLLEFGRRPLRRPQPNQRMVLMIKALRSVQRRVHSVRITPQHRQTLTHLLHEALDHTKLRLRDALRPAIAGSLEAADLHPGNAAEKVAQRKLTEELLDGVTQRGFLTLGNVRDAISRNQIKFQDLPRPEAFLGGDQLLRINRRLSDSLDGVYHRGEIYLRFFQRASSLLFATRSGRLITRTIIMPLAGAYIIVEALDHTVFLLARKITGRHSLKLSHLEELRHEPFGQFLLHNIPFILLALILLGALNWGEFRSALLRGLRGFGRLLGVLVLDVPKAIARHPWVQAIFKSRSVRLFFRYAIKPLAVACLAVLLLPHEVSPRGRLIVLACVFAVSNLLLNSPQGRALEQAALHYLRLVWTRVTSDILANLFRGILHFFAKMLERLDRVLYAVDEWLRFRAGQSGFSLLAKAALGVAWFYVAYATRFAINLLVEPQINPIKHFPVVTVSHKIVLPTVGVFASALETLGITRMRARTLAAGIVTVIPGIFGFLAWELKENWKLYRANRPRTLRPVQVGSHGESVARLLRPGLHSGTIPKIFARLRRYQLRLDQPRYDAARVSAAIHKQHEAVDHVRESVANFIDRELIALLNQHPAWQQSPVAAGGVHLSATRIDIDLLCPQLGESSTQIFFEQRGGWILAGIGRLGWIPKLSPPQTDLLTAALLGLCKIAGVDIIKERIESLSPSEPIAFELSRDHLTVWRAGRFEAPTVYPLRADPAAALSAPTPADILLRSTVITWEQWVQIWDPHHSAERRTAASASSASTTGL